MENVYDDIHEVELDPLHPDNLADRYPTAIPHRSNSMDVVIAGEILEHLYSPLHLLAEVSRILKPGGHLVLTTPNVCYIGNIAKLITGHSCHESLKTSHLFYHSEWRAHMRIYDRHETAALCSPYGMQEERIHFLDNGEYLFYKSPWIRRKMLLLRPFFLFPRYRNNLCQVFRKTEG